MNERFQNKVIVIGGEHHNTLGMIRSLGEKGVNVFLIVIGSGSSFISKSKYLVKYWRVNNNEREVIDIFLNEFGNEQNKPIVVPTSDVAVNIIDKNYDILKERYILHNASQKQGKIIELMNKKTMNELAQEAGLSVPKSWELTLTQNRHIMPQDIKYPCIIKPLASIEGKRQDIIKCTNEFELRNYLSKYSLIYKRLLIQEFIEKEHELGVVGCRTISGKVIMPGVIKKIREYPIKSGSASFAKISNNFDGIPLKNISRFLDNLQYSGIFDMEFLYANGNIFFIEVNFRNGGNGYAVTKAGVNLPYIWCIDAVGLDISSYQRKILSDLIFMMDTRDIRHVFNRDLSLLKWIKDLISTKSFLLFNIKDLKPFIYKIIGYKMD